MTSCSFCVHYGRVAEYVCPASMGMAGLEEAAKEMESGFSARGLSD